MTYMMNMIYHNVVACGAGSLAGTCCIVRLLPLVMCRHSGVCRICLVHGTTKGRMDDLHCSVHDVGI